MNQKNIQISHYWPPDFFIPNLKWALLKFKATCIKAIKTI